MVVLWVERASVEEEDMLSAAQNITMELKPEAGTGVSPFEDIAAVHAMYEARVFRFLLMSLRDRDVAMSLTQDTFLNAWRARESFQGDCSIATWLMRIAVNLLRSHTRTERYKFWKRAAASSVDVADVPLRHDAASAESALVARQRLAQVWEAVETLSERQKMAFLLRFVDELELPEIAAAMDLTLPTAKSHLYRAMDRVRAVQREMDAKRGTV